MKIACLTALALTTFISIPALAQQSAEEPGEGRNHAEKREEWFARKRTVNGKLRGDLRLKALQQRNAMHANDRARFKARFGSATPSQAMVMSTTTSSDPSDYSLAASMTQWTSIGPSPVSDVTRTFSGRVEALALDPRNSNVLYAGAADGGIWKTTDAGVTWKSLTDFQNSLSTGSLELDPANPDTVYVGTGEGSFGISQYYGAGVLKSTDGGTTWTNIQAPFVTGPNSLRIPVMEVYPGDHNVVLAGTTRSTGAGIYRSTDGGSTWTQVLSNAPVYAVRFLPNAPTTALAVGFDQNTDAQAIFRSTDAGQTWQKVLNTAVDLGFGDLTALGSLALGTGHNTIYAALGGIEAAQLYKSTDNGLNWTAINNKLPSGQTLCNTQCWYDLTIAVHPTDPNLVYFGAVSLFRSTDGGSTWTIVSSPHADYHTLVFTPAGDKLYAGNDGGVWMNSDPRASSITWNSLNQQLATLQFYPGISIFPGNPNFSIGGTQDNGTLRFTGSTQWTQVLGGDGFQTAIDPTTTSLLYATTQQGWVWRSTNGGADFTLQTDGLSLASPSFATPLTMDPHNRNRLYTAPSTVIYRSDNNATSWTSVQQNAFAEAVNNISVAPQDENTVYVSIGHGYAISRNAISASAPTWNNFAGPSQSREVTWIAADANDPNTAYIGLAGFSVQDGKGHVYKITNAGATFTNISGNLPDAPVNQVIVDPDVPNALYAATDVGVFATSNGGQTWNALVTGLPHSIVMSVALDRSTRILRAATHGRSMWDLQLPAAPPLCAPPTTNGVNICTPTNGATVSSPVRVTAAGKMSNPMKLMELWIDGVKKASQPGGQLDYSATLANGTHALTVYAVDTSDAKTNKKISITVNTTSSTCSAPSAGVNVCSPPSGGTVSSPVRVLAAAKSSTNAPIVSMELWADGAKKTTQSGDHLDFTLSFTNGSHNVSVYGIDSSNTKVNKKVFFTVGTGSTTCNPPSSPGVNICTPAAGATVASPVHFTAAATSTSAIKNMEVWVDGVKKTTQTGNHVDYTTTLAGGGHTVSIFGIDTAGVKVNKKIAFTVSP